MEEDGEKPWNKLAFRGVLHWNRWVLELRLLLILLELNRLRTFLVYELHLFLTMEKLNGRGKADRSCLKSQAAEGSHVLVPRYETIRLLFQI